MNREKLLFLGKLALAGFMFPLVWALLVPIAIELWHEEDYSDSPSNRPVDPGLARVSVRV